VLVVGLSGSDVSDALASHSRDEHLVLDLVNLPNSTNVRGKVEGLCW
jgi:hypothetical protein